MKIRIQGNSIRLRLSQPEVSSFAAEGACMGKLEFPNGNTLVYRLSSSSKASAVFENNTITLMLPEADIQTWANTDQVGMKANLSLENEDNLSILVEKDFKCLTDRGVDESDLFPNPAESH